MNSRLNKCVAQVLVCGIILSLPSVAAASCRVLDDGKNILLGKFPFANAGRDCLRVYKNHYLRKDNDGESELKLQCEGSEQTIAYVKDGKFFETGINVAGCAIPKTMG